MRKDNSLTVEHANQETPLRSALDPIKAIPEETARYYRELGIYKDQTIGQLFEEAAKKYADNSCAIGVCAREGFPTSSLNTVSWSYRQWWGKSLEAAAHLRSLGAKPGDRVLLQLPNILEYISYMTGAFLAGLVPIFCLPKHREKEVEHFARQVDAAVHIFAQGAENYDYAAMHKRYSKRMAKEGLNPPAALNVCENPPADLEPLAEPLEPVADRGRKYLSENTAFMQLSGGTTGISKLIPRNHTEYLYSVRESAQICGLNEQTKMLVVIPAAHNFMMSSPGILGALYAGSSLILAADPSPQTCFSLIEKYQITFAPLVTPLLQGWILLSPRRQPNLTSLELIQVGGAKLAPSVARQVEPVLGASLQQVFGMAEGLVTYTRENDPPELVATTQGTPISAYDEIRIVDEREQPVPPGQPGSLFTRGPYTICSYYRDDRANVTSFTSEGFYRTGDIVKQHASGHLEVIGREKDQINRAGEKISVEEIEDFTLSLPQTIDAVAVGVADPTVGERICLVILTESPESFSNHPLSLVREKFREAGFAEYKIPERVKIVTEFPFTNVGKISRKQLREQLVKDLES